MQNNVEVVVRGIWTVEYIDHTDGDKLAIHVAADEHDAWLYAESLWNGGLGSNIRVLLDGKELDRCIYCRGTGWLDIYSTSGPSYGAVLGGQPCADCRGTGVK